MKKTILLADMNSFFASVHQALEPSLKNKPVIVGGSQEKRHGIVLASSYPAKVKGVKTGMTTFEAKRLCPKGIFIAPRHPLYIHFSTRILQIMKDFTPLVEPFSIDEAFLDITGCCYLPQDPAAAARLLKKRISREVDIPCSIGIGPNKLLAKMAAEMQKPDGLTLLPSEDIPQKLWPLPVRALFGIGRRYEQHLRYFNIRTIGDLANFPVKILKKRFGIMGEVMWWSANGIDHSPVNPHTLDNAKSVGHQVTLPRNFTRLEDIAVILLELSERVARRARQGGSMGKTVHLVLKDHNFNYMGYSKTLRSYTDLTEDVYETALYLLKQQWSGYPVRMVGLSLEGLLINAAPQGDIFGKTEKLRRVAHACDRIRTRFGEKSIKRASSLTEAGILYE